MLIYIIYAFIIGFISAPLIFELITNFFLQKYARRRLPFIADKLKMSKLQKIIFKNSLHKTTDLAWFNVFLNRYWYELAHSYAHKDRIARSIQKKMNIMKKKKMVLDIFIDDVFISNESPILESVTVLTSKQFHQICKICDKNYQHSKENEIEKLLKNDFDNKFEKMFMECKDQSNEIKKNLHHFDELENEYSRTLQRKNNQKIKQFQDVLRDSDQLDENFNFERDFSQIFLLVDMKYLQAIVLNLTLHISLNYTLETQISIGNFQGKGLMRLPANNSKNKWEFSFIENPGYQVNVSAVVKNIHKKNEYFKGFFSRILKRIISKSLLKKTIYPNFHPLMLPSLTYNIKYVHHRIQTFDMSKYGKWTRDVTHRLFLYTSMNYRIINKYKEITWRKNSHFINGDTDRIHQIELDLRDNVQKVEQIEIESKNSIASTKQNVEINHYEKKFNIKGIESIMNLLTRMTNLNQKSLAVLSYFYNLNIFKSINSDFLLVKEIKKFDERVTLLKIYFKNHVYDYVRIVKDNKIIFQRNSLKEPEFIIIGMENDRLEVYYYLISDPIKLDFNLAKKIFKCIINSDIASFNPDIDISNFENHSSLSFIKRFKAITDNVHTFSKKTVNLKMLPSDLMSLLKDPLLRFRLIFENLKIIDREQIGEQFHHFSVLLNNGMNKIADLVSLYGENEISDANIADNGSACIFKIIKENEINTLLEIYTNHTSKDNIKYNFVRSLMLQKQFLKPNTKMNVLPFLYNKNLKYQFTHGSGYFFMYLHGEISDDFYLTIKIDDEPILQEMKIILTKPTRIVLTFIKKTDISVYIRPKIFRNRKIFLKALHVSENFENLQKKFLFETITSLGTNKSNKIKFDMNQGQVLFWDFQYEENMIQIVKSNNYESFIEGLGILECEKDIYKITMKNKGPKNKDIRYIIGYTEKIIK